MSTYTYPMAPEMSLDIKLGECRHGLPLVALDGPYFNGVELNPAQLRGLAAMLQDAADKAEEYLQEFDNAGIKSPQSGKKITVFGAPKDRPVVDTRGLTRSDIARKVGCSVALVNRVARGDYNCGIGKSYKVALILGLNPTPRNLGPTKS
jgi:gp16 family phage-associated protein